MKSYSTKTAGYSLIEVLIAISILLLSIVGPMTIAAKGIQSGVFVSEQATATFLAQEGIESIVAIRNEYILQNVGTSAVWDWTLTSGSNPIRDCVLPNGCNISWNSSGAHDIIPCNSPNSCVLRYNDSSGERSPYQIGSSGDVSKYTRVIDLNVNGDEVEVISRVTWKARVFGNNDRTVELRTRLFKLYGD